MRAYVTGRGRKKAVKRFTIRQDLLMAVLILGAMIGMALLFEFGVFRID